MQRVEIPPGMTSAEAEARLAGRWVPPMFGARVTHQWSSTVTAGVAAVTAGNGSMGTAVSIDSGTATTDAYIVHVHQAGNSANNTDRRFLLDLGIYDGTTDFWQVTNIDIGAITSTAMGTSLLSSMIIPMHVPAGYRVRARTQQEGGTTAVDFSANTYGSPGVSAWAPGEWAVWETLGASTADTKGIVVTPNASANTFGTAVNYGISTMTAVGYFLGIGLNGNALIGSGISYRIKLDDTNSVLYDDYAAVFLTTSTESYISYQDCAMFHFRLFPTPVPAGTTFRATAMGSGASAPAVTTTLHLLCI